MLQSSKQASKQVDNESLKIKFSTSYIELYSNLSKEKSKKKKREREKERYVLYIQYNVYV